MTYKEYNQLTIRTLPNLDEVYRLDSIEKSHSLPLGILDLSHMIFGMISELEELDKAITNHDDINIAEESTDILWYVSCYKHVRKIDKDFHFENEFMKNTEGQLAGYDFLDLTSAISKLSDAPKKFLAYKRPIDVVEEIENYTNLLCVINNFAHENEIDLSKSMENNINKLRVRFPNKFDFDKAQQENRDLDSERKELEK